MSRLLASLLAPLLVRCPPLPFALAVVLSWLLERWLPVRLPLARPLGVALLGAGVALDGWSIASQLRAGTSPVPAGRTAELVVTGPYAWSRNPIYIAHTLVAGGLGLALWRSGWAVLGAGLAWAATDRWTVPAEEAELARLFGADFEEYAGRVRRWR